MTDNNLFQPIRVGRMDLKHRVVLAPLTRARASTDHVVGELIKRHYELRATVPGTLLISEGAFMTPRDTAGPFWRQPPGIWNAVQVAGWKNVVEAVHARGSYIYCQLITLGRLIVPELLSSLDPSSKYLSAGTTPVPGWSRAPEVMSKEDIKTFVRYFADTAGAAVNGADFDGVEVAATYLVEEFLKNISNDRTDEYGFQSPENAARFCLEILDAVVKRVGEDRVGLKVNPWTRWQVFDGDIKPVDPRPVYSYLVTEVRKRYPNLAFLHVIESRVIGDADVVAGESETNDFLREIWKGKPFFTDGGYQRETAVAEAEKYDDELIVFGRLYTSNPDLPLRLKYDIALTKYDRSTFYIDGAEEGYNTFGFSAESKKILSDQGVDVAHL